MRKYVLVEEKDGGWNIMIYIDNKLTGKVYCQNMTVLMDALVMFNGSRMAA